MKCDEGYQCEVCGRDVTSIVDSDLYLRFVIGELDPETLHTSAERHLRCNPILAQFIAADDFEPLIVEGEMAKQSLDQRFVQSRTELVTRGYKRLQEVSGWDGDRDIREYPLEEARAKYQA